MDVSIPCPHPKLPSGSQSYWCTKHPSCTWSHNAPSSAQGGCLWVMLGLQPTLLAPQASEWPENENNFQFSETTSGLPLKTKVAFKSPYGPFSGLQRPVMWISSPACYPLSLEWLHLDARKGRRAQTTKQPHIDKTVLVITTSKHNLSLYLTIQDSQQLFSTLLLKMLKRYNGPYVLEAYFKLQSAV